MLIVRGWSCVLPWAESQGWAAELVGVRIIGVERFTSAAIQSVDGVAGAPLHVQVRVGVVAELDVRHDRDLEYNDLMDLIDEAGVDDAGFGLIDPWVHLQLHRSAVLVGDVLLDLEGNAEPVSRLASVELPRRPLPHGQLRLELL